MPWAVGALHDLSHRTDVEDARIGLGVDRRHLGGEERRSTSRLQQTSIGLEVAGVGLEVAGIVELCGVDKDTDDT